MTPSHPPRWADTKSRVPVLVATEFVVSSWAWLYTLAAPRDARTARRTEILSDLHDHMEQGREEGVVPTQTSLQMMARMMLGILDDVIWAGQQVPSAALEYLKRRSEVAGHLTSSPLAVSSLAMLGLMNWTLAMSDLVRPWFEWVVVNAAVLIVAMFLLRREFPVLCGPSWALSTCATFLTIAFASWMVFGTRLEQVPAMPQLAFDAILMILLVVSGTVAAAGVCRVHVSWGEWWPLWLCWGTVGFATWGATIPTGGGLTGLGELSLATALVCLGWLALAAFIAFAFRVACHGGLSWSAWCMGWLVTAIRTR